MTLFIIGAMVGAASTLLFYGMLDAHLDHVEEKARKRLNKDDIPPVNDD